MEDKTKTVNTFIKRILKKHTGLVAVFIFLVVSLIFIYNYKPELEGMSLEKFSKIKIGMTYDEVVDIIGEEGEVYMKSDEGTAPEDAVIIYAWYSEDGVSSANITFKNNIVRAKKQSGLK